MDINFNFFDGETEEKLFLQLKQWEITIMATLQDIKTEVAGITDAIAAQQTSFNLLVKEVRQLLAQGDLAGADELLAEIQQDKQAILDAVALNTELAAQADAVNGDPSPAE